MKHDNKDKNMSEFELAVRRIVYSYLINAYSQNLTPAKCVELSTQISESIIDFMREKD